MASEPNKIVSFFLSLSLLPFSSSPPGVIGGAFVLLAVVGVALFALAKVSPTIAGNFGMDDAFGTGAVNPTYVS